MAGYGDDTAFAAWLVANGYTLPAGAPTAAVLRQRGSDYIDGLYGSRFPGLPTAGLAQERAWPRTGAEAFGVVIPEGLTPSAVERASYASAWHEAQRPGALAVVTDPSARKKRQKVDVIETEWFEPGAGDSAAPVLTAVEGLLAPFLLPPAPEVALGIRAIG